MKLLHTLIVLSAYAAVAPTGCKSRTKNDDVTADAPATGAEASANNEFVTAAENMTNALDKAKEGDTSALDSAFEESGITDPDERKNVIQQLVDTIKAHPVSTVAVAVSLVAMGIGIKNRTQIGTYLNDAWKKQGQVGPVKKVWGVINDMRKDSATNIKKTWNGFWVRVNEFRKGKGEPPVETPSATEDGTTLWQAIKQKGLLLAIKENIMGQKPPAQQPSVK